MSELGYYKHFRQKESGICVIAKHGESLHDLIKRFKKKFSRSGIAIELRENSFYEKPSIRKKKKRAVAKLRRLKEQEKLLKPRKKDEEDTSQSKHW